MSLPVAAAIFWITVALCTIAELFIIRSAFVKRANVRRAPEIIWAIIPAVGLALLLAATWRAMHPVAIAPTSATALVDPS